MLALLLGLGPAQVAHGATLRMYASQPHAEPYDVLTFTLVVEATRDAQVRVDNPLPFGVYFAGQLSPPGAQYAGGVVRWAGWMAQGERVEIRYAVRVAKPETLGTRPIVNRACVDDGQEVCTFAVVTTGWHKRYLPLVRRAAGENGPRGWTVSGRPAAMRGVQRGGKRE